MSAAEQQEPQLSAIHQKTETRRNALLRRLDTLMGEMNVIRRELMSYSIGVTDAEIEPVIEQMYENKTRLLIDVPEETMENVLAIYDPKEHVIVEKHESIDSITEATMMTLIERNVYTSSVDLQSYEEPLALRFRVGDEFHGSSIGEGMLLISSLKKTNNDAQWFAYVENGSLTYSDQLKAFDGNGLQSKIERLLEEEGGPTLTELEGYFLFVGDAEKFSEFLTPDQPEVPTPVEHDVSDRLDLVHTPTNDYLAKIGPNGRIRYRTSTADLVKQIAAKGLPAKQILNRINDLAIDRVEDAKFVYVILN